MAIIVDIFAGHLRYKCLNLSGCNLRSTSRAIFLMRRQLRDDCDTNQRTFLRLVNQVSMASIVVNGQQFPVLGGNCDTSSH